MKVKYNNLVESYLPLAYSMASRYYYKGIDHEELRGIAVIGLLKARDVFDPTRAGFGTIARYMVLNELTKAFQKQSIRFNLHNEHNQYLSTTEETVTLLDIVPCKDPTIDKLIDQDRLTNLVRDSLGALPERSRYIVENRYINEVITYRELGEILGVSFQRIRQIERRSLELLREHIEDTYEISNGH